MSRPQVSSLSPPRWGSVQRSLVGIELWDASGCSARSVFRLKRVPDREGFTDAGRGHAARRYSWMRPPKTSRCVTAVRFGPPLTGAALPAERPFPPHQLPVPAKKGLRPDDERRPEGPRQCLARGGKECPVKSAEPRPPHLRRSTLTWWRSTRTSTSLSRSGRRPVPRMRRSNR